MSTDRVLEAVLFSDFLESLFQGIIGGHFQFCCDGSETRLHQPVDIAFAGAAHALLHLSAVENVSVLLQRVLTAAIGMVNQFH